MRARRRFSRHAPRRDSRASASNRAVGDEEDLYEVLGVSESATESEIHKAYRQQAKKCHPDVSKEPGAAERFKRLSVAYQTLKDREKRSEYDRLRKGRRGAPSGEWRRQSKATAGQAAQEEPFYGLKDFLRDMEEEFEEARRRSAQRRGEASVGGLWADLGALGEELLDFLEENLPEATASANQEEEYQSPASTAGQSSSVQASSEQDIEEELREMKRRAGRG